MQDMNILDINILNINPWYTNIWDIKILDIKLDRNQHALKKLHTVVLFLLFWYYIELYLID